MRVPFVARFPGSIPAGQVNSTGIATALDLMPTVASLTGAALPANPMDGVNIWPMLSLTQDSVTRDAFLYIDTYNIQAARLGPWKLHVARYNTPPWVPLPKIGRSNLPLANPELYNILNDPGESSDVSQDYPQIVTEIQARIDSLVPNMPSQVQSAWKTTTSTPVQWSATGAWPLEAETSSLEPKSD
jgi:arylsulfatase